MSDSSRYWDWIESAQKDIRAAKILLDYAGDYDIIAFHAHQAIEKGLKAYLLYHGHSIHNTHSLTYLIKQGVQFDADFNQFARPLVKANRYYIKTRYPSDLPMVLSKEDAGEAYNLAKQLLDLIQSKAD